MATSVWVTWPSLMKYGSLGVIAGMLTLAGTRADLSKSNLIAVEDLTALNATIQCDERSLGARTEDGTCNILNNPAEGSVFRRFGRNVSLESVQAEVDAGTLLTPNPREVSNVLMARNEFKPATSVNFMVASWIQFQVHDWMDHGLGKVDDHISVPLPPGDPLGSGTMQIRRTLDDTSRTAADSHLPPTYQNINTHWWDASQVYGSDKATSDKLRSFSGGKLKINPDGTLPTDMYTNIPVTGFNENWWVGLSMLHQLFAKEHNAVAEMLAAKNPGKSDQWLYDKARLVVSALIAKIHTVEWTPAVIANKVGENVMYANWWGLLGSKAPRDWYNSEIRQIMENLEQSDSNFKKILGFDPGLSELIKGNSDIDHALSGLVGSPTPQNHGTDFTLPEEFVAVYRMHPFLRDNLEVYNIGANRPSKVIPIENTAFGDAENLLDQEGAARLWYSFGITHPGSLTLNNFPEFLRNLPLPGVGTVDMATIDIVRDRERGVPRYNEFRRQIQLNPITKFEDLTTDPTTLANLKRLYNNDVEQIDALVGQLAETVRPEGYAFGETAFQIFILNASRRLMTDRFFTTDYRPEVYTQEGLDWVEDNTMVDVLKRHFPELSLSLTGVENAFKPWSLNMPENYDSLSAETKADLLWVNGALRSEYNEGELPALKKTNTGAMISSILWDKVRKQQDVAPEMKIKPIHAHGAMAKVKFVPTDSTYTGLFQGSEHGFLRLSVTEDPAGPGFQPGLAWKAFVDGKPSQNVSALYTLEGQGNNYNIFANEMSSYVLPQGDGSLGGLVLFSLVTTKPTLLRVDDMAEVKQDGSTVSKPKAPTQVYFVPHAEVKGLFSTAAHDFRNDLTSLTPGTKVYDIYATSAEIKTSLFKSTRERYARERRASAKKIGEMVLTSEFVASEFGDSGVFFKHQRHEDK